MTEALDPKTCSIERLVTVRADVDKVVAGVKTAARRNGRYADPGEVMEMDGHRFVVERVYRQSLGDMTDEHARQEGFDTLERYKEYIVSMHRGMKWLPHMNVWVHEFKKLDDAD
ncbi:ASCH domain-containing protein [Paenibacillus flagellatus]